MGRELKKAPDWSANRVDELGMFGAFKHRIAHNV